MSRRKTETEKKKQGTRNATRERTRKAPRRVSLTGLPAPLEDLNNDERKIYARLCNHLLGADALHDVDAYLITAAAVNLNQMRIAIAQLREQGPIQEFDNGTRNVSPEYSIFEKCNNMLRQHSRLLGLDPRSRQDLLIFLESGEGQDDDPAGEGIGGPGF